ncbi:MAG: vanadium-dependent haloperoxidase [Humibacillus sp.]|nr:vanadium-dependent haloperoxidase [Humibacillus sp.]MDN5779509.1 vanadium-dependent haloperoxidase [Humibacillus sp.]
MNVRAFKRVRMSVSALTLGALLVGVPSVSTSASGRPPAPMAGCGHADGTAVVGWNLIASQVTGVDAVLPAPLMSIPMSYVQAAVYNAVAGVEGSRSLYDWKARAPHCASTDAAAAAAARSVLLRYFPGSAARVGSAFDTALAAVPDGPAKADGIEFGQRAAEHLIARRAEDGWQGSAPYLVAPSPGVWVPTPPAYAPVLAPWLGKMKPFFASRADRFRPSGPPTLSSARYTRDLQEIAEVGSVGSTTRTAEQTEVARFFGGNLTDQLNAGYRDHIARHHLGAVAAARYLAVANLAQSDAVIGSWDAKLHYSFWRPVTAIRQADTDGNARTVADPSWTPLLVTPPFPEYVSAHTVVMGAVVTALATLEGRSHLDLNLPSAVTGTVRHYQTGAQLRADGVDARVWAGIHFRSSDEAGDRMGVRLGAWISGHFLTCAGLGTK